MTIIIHGDSGVTFPDTTVQGTAVPLASNAETQAGIVANKAVTPASLAASKLVLGTAQAASGTSIDFTGIPSWVKRVTVMLSGVSTNGTSGLQVQLGAGSVTTTGYNGAAASITTAASVGALLTTAGFQIPNTSAATTTHGSIIFSILSSNNWVANGVFNSRGDTSTYVSGSIALGGTLDRIRLTTVNGTDTFDAGSVNILYE